MTTPCPWCQDNVACVHIPDADTVVCGFCARDYAAWEREDRGEVAEGYDGPHFVDTMSGGVMQLD